MKVIKPGQKDAYSQYYDKDDIKIFLAGSIEMGTAEDWQVIVSDTFSDRDRLVFFNPRRDDWDSSWEQKESNPEFNYQVNWELDRLTDSDIIFMYFSPETKSPISLLELGLYAGSNKRMVVCCPDGFWRKGNVDIVCSRFNIQVYDSLEKGIGRLRTMIR